MARRRGATTGPVRESRLRRLLRLALRVSLGLVVLGGLYVGVTFVQVWMAAGRDSARPSEAIVVLGAAQFNGEPSAVLRARLDHAYDLYAEGLAPVIVVTGGNQPGDRFTEAGVAAEYLHGKGVPDEDILREVRGTSSWESLAAAAGFLGDRGITDVILVSDPFHSYRIGAIADELGLRGVTSPTRTSPIGGTTELRYLAQETAAVSLSRFLGYRRLAGIGEVVRSRVG